MYVYSDGANAKLRIEDIVRYTINEFAKISSRNVVNTNELGMELFYKYLP